MKYKKTKVKIKMYEYKNKFLHINRETVGEITNFSITLNIFHTILSFEYYKMGSAKKISFLKENI